MTNKLIFQMFRNLDFKPGRALRNKELWLQDVNILKLHHYPVPSFAESIIRKGLVSLTHSHVYNRARRKVSFNNEDFDCVESLETKYRCKEDPNYQGARNQEEILRKMVTDYEKSGILREGRSHELSKIVINPVNILETKKGKWSLICHSLHNSKYKESKIELFDPTKESHILKKIEEFRCEDLKSAYSHYL